MADAFDEPLLLPDQLDALRGVGIEKQFLPGERIVSIGAESTEVFYLLTGLVKIVVVAPNGSESVFALRSPGEFVGEMSTLNGARRSADVVAIEPTTTVMVGAARFTRFLEALPEVALALLRMQSGRLNQMTMRTVIGSRSVKARVAQRLLELSAQADPEALRDPKRGIVVRLTQSDLAQWIDASREWTSKALGELQRDGAIRTARGRVTVTDVDMLRTTSFDDAR